VDALFLAKGVEDYFFQDGNKKILSFRVILCTLEVQKAKQELNSSVTSCNKARRGEKIQFLGGTEEAPSRLGRRWSKSLEGSAYWD
jgi:hypothetical protein